MPSSVALAVALFLASTTLALGQGAVTGTVADSIGTQPLAGCRVALTRTSDSTRLGAIAGTDGTFRVGSVPAGQYVVLVTSVGFKPLRRVVTVPEAGIDLGRLRLGPDNRMAETVVVTEKAPLAVQRGDTVEMSASAYKTAKDASAEDLVQKMPGVTMQDGKVQAQGEQVRQVLVDGRRFFGDDPNVALRNLPAEMIDKVQVFDQASEQNRFTGASDANGSKTINIVTKPSMRNGQFGRVFAGGGDDERYRAGVVMNAFQGDARITVLAQTNNVNEQNFAVEDIVGAMGGGGGGGRGGFRRPGGPGPGGGGRPMMGGGGGMSDFFVGQNNGINTTHAAGVNYADKWGTTVDAQASYFFNWSGNDASQSLFRTFVLPDVAGQTYDQATASTSTNMNHRVNGRFEVRLDSLNSFVWTPRFTAQTNDGGSDVRGVNTLNNVAQSTTSNTTSSDLLGLTFDSDLLYRRAFATPGRTFSVNLGVSTSANDGTSTLQSITGYTDAGQFFDTLNQRGTTDRNGLTLRPNITYTEPLDSSSSLSLSVSSTIQMNDADARTFAAANTPAEVLDTSLTNTFSSTYATHQFTPTYRIGDRDLGADIGVTLQYATLDNARQFPVTADLVRSFTNVLPSAAFRWNITMDQSMRLFYRTSTSSPTVDQLQDVINNSNPLQLSTGNADLDQTLTHNLFLRYSNNDVGSATSFFAFVGASVTQDYVANSVTIATADTMVAPGIVLARGGQFTRPVNLDGYLSLRSFLNYSMPLAFIQSNLNLNGGVTYTRTPGEINGAANIANAPSANVGVSVSSNISEEIDFTVSTNMALNSVRNTLQSQNDADYINGTSRLRFNWRIIGGLVWSGDVANTLTSGYTAGYDQSVWLVNTALAYKFLENDRAELRLSINDLLNQNTAISRTVSESYTDDTRSNLLQRYGLLTFTYNIRNFPSM